ncbi:MAG: YfhO family protein [Thermoleophilaceae bacterium]|nr:YfhO family protein [Thermoleophilaceae bacterium]
MTALRRRPVAAAALLYAVLAVLLYSPALLPGHTLSASDYLWTAAPWASERPPDVRPFGSNYELVDSVTQFQPWLQHVRDRIPEAPLWNPAIGAGRPFLANAQSAILSPFYVLSYALPFWWSLGVIAVLKVFAAAFGTFLLGRALGMRYGGSLLAGLVYGFSLYMLVWISWPQTNVWALLPWLLLLTERVIRAPGPLPAAGLGAVVAAQFFGGHPESNFHLLAATVAFFAFRLWVLHREGGLDGVRAPVVAFAGGLVGGTALAAVVLLPFLELLFRSGDVSAREGFAQLKLPREYLRGFMLPDYWGRATHGAVGAFAQERALYVGALPLTLAIFALVSRPNAMRIGFAALGALVLALALGVPPLPDIAAALPIVKTGNHLRVVVILMLCLALLAGWGLDELTAADSPRRWLVVPLALALLALPVLVLGAGGWLSGGELGRALELSFWLDHVEPPVDDASLTAIRMSSLLVWLAFMGAAAVLLFARVRGRVAATTFVALALALVAADLFKAGMGATPAITTAEATQPLTPGIEYLRSQRPNRFVGLAPDLGPSALIPDMAMRWDLYDARSYDLPVEERYDNLWRAAVKDGSPTETPTTDAVLSEQALPAYRLLSVTRVAQDPTQERVRDPALPVAYDGRDLRVYAVRDALPRVAVVGSQRVVPGDDAQLAAVIDPAFDARRTVVTGAALPGLPEQPTAGSAGRARITTYEPERVVIEASARRPAELVLSDVHFPGWRAEIDGEETGLHRVNYLLRGVGLPAGRHRVELRYEPASFRAGLILSLVALAGLAGAAAIGLRRRGRVRVGDD